MIQAEDSQGKSFLFGINGVKAFAKGANWIPEDNLLPQITQEDYLALISLAKEAHMNMLRVWGGGIYEDDEFYDFCDEQGVMVWQDFMCACAQYPDEFDWFQRLAWEEAIQIVKSLCNHPSLVFWCGNNENNWGFHSWWKNGEPEFLGKLSEAKAEQIRLILKVVEGKEHILSSLENAVPLKSLAHLEIAVANQLWQDWQIDRAFDNHKITKSPVPTPAIARVLTINRCVEPTSCYSIQDWVKTTTLPQTLNLDPEILKDDKLYYELDKIEANKESLENFLFHQTYQLNPESYNYVNYDLSTSYFVGIKCPLSRLGKSKDGQPHCKQVILAMMVNEDGYPFKWDVLPGNTAEATTLKDKVEACKNRFHLQDISLVFDRGIISEDNLQSIDEDESQGQGEKRSLKYISTLDKNQIVKVEGVNLQIFQDLTLENIKEKISSLPRFTRYDEILYYQDLGPVEGKRYILGINPVLFIEARNNRQEKIELFLKFISQLNQQLREAKRDRNKKVIRDKVKKQLGRLKIRRFFTKPVILKINPTRILAQGSIKKIISYQVSIKKREEKIKEASLLDGVCCFVTNHTENKDKQFLFPAEKIIYGYRNKRKIEDAFKHLKSFLRIRPFRVNLDEHVKAVHTICVLAYFLNLHLVRMRSKHEKTDFLNSKNLYRPFKNSRLIKLKDDKFGWIKEKIIKPELNDLKIIQQLGFSHLLDNKRFPKTSGKN